MGEVRLDKYNNSWYKPGSNVLVRGIWYLVNHAFVNAYWLPFSGLKTGILRLFGARIGKGVVIKPKVNIKYPWKLEVGDHAWIGEKVWIDNLGKVTIGDHACLSQGSMLLCGNHNYNKSTFDLIVGDITLENGVWIGAHAIVAPGTICRENSVLSANSVGSGELDRDTIYQGNPATAVKTRNIED